MQGRKYLRVDFKFIGEGRKRRTKVFAYPAECDNADVEDWIVNDKIHTYERTPVLKGIRRYDEIEDDRDVEIVLPPCTDCGEHLLYNGNTEEWFCCVCKP